MALVKCKECGNEISTQAAACPKCGAKPPAKTSMLTWIIGAIMLVFVYQCTQRSGFADRPTVQVSPQTAVPVTTGVTSSPTSAKAEDLPPGTSWSYTTDVDKMTSKPVHFATIDSTNSMNLSFPYGGHNRGHLTIRSKGAGSPDVLFQIDKGQTMCRSYKYDCEISVRFDDRPPVKFLGIGASDGSTENAFLNNTPRFIAEAKKAKYLKVSMNIYQAGTQVLEFGPLQPLDWPKK